MLAPRRRTAAGPHEGAREKRRAPDNAEAQANCRIRIIGHTTHQCKLGSDGPVTRSIEQHCGGCCALRPHESPWPAHAVAYWRLLVAKPIHAACTGWPFILSRHAFGRSHFVWCPHWQLFFTICHPPTRSSRLLKWLLGRLSVDGFFHTCEFHAHIRQGLGLHKCR